MLTQNIRQQSPDLLDKHPQLDQDSPKQQSNTTSDQQWRQNYQNNVFKIKKQLEDLRKATADLRRKISMNQKGVKKAMRKRNSRDVRLVGKRLGREDTEMEIVEEQNQNKSVKIKRLNSYHEGLINSLVKKIFQDSQNQPKQQSYFQIFTNKLRNAHDYLLKIIVQDRIKRPARARRVVKMQSKQGMVKVKPHAHAHHARRLKSRRSILV